MNHKKIVTTTLCIIATLLLGCDENDSFTENNVKTSEGNVEIKNSYPRGSLLEVPLSNGAAIIRPELNTVELEVWYSAHVNSIIYGGALGIGVRDYKKRKEWERSNISSIKKLYDFKVSGSVNLFFIYPPYNFEQYEQDFSLKDIASENKNGEFIFKSEKYFACFNKPAYNDFLVWWIKDQTANSGFDGMHLDWPEITAFPGVDCQCSHCTQKWNHYSSLHSEALPILDVAINSDDNETKFHYKKFRLDSVLESIAHLKREMSKTNQEFKLDITSALRPDSLYLIGNSREALDVYIGENTTRSLFAPEGEQLSFYKLAYGLSNNKAVGSLDYYGSYDPDTGNYKEFSHARGHVYMAEVLAMEGFTWLGWLGSPIENNRELISKYYKFRSENMEYYENTSFLGKTAFFLPSTSLLGDADIMLKYLKMAKLLHKLKIPFYVISEKDISTRNLNGIDNLIIMGNTYINNSEANKLFESITQTRNVILIADSNNENVSYFRNLVEGKKLNWLELNKELDGVDEKRNLVLNSDELKQMEQLASVFQNSGVSIEGYGSENISVVTRKTENHYLIHLVNYNALLHVGWRWEDQLAYDESVFLESITVDLSGLLEFEDFSVLTTSPASSPLNIVSQKGKIKLEEVGPYTLLVIDRKQ